MARSVPGYTTELRSFFEANRHGIVSAYLFGSHADGRAHAESDVDVAVLLDRRTFPSVQKRFEQRIELIGALGPALRTNGVDLVVLNDAPPHLVRRIMLDGLRIFCSDAALDHAARRDAQLRAADLEPFLRRARVVKLRAIAR
jgi:predicted nucleotidyltransferase